MPDNAATHSDRPPCMFLSPCPISSLCFCVLLRSVVPLPPTLSPSLPSSLPPPFLPPRNSVALINLSDDSEDEGAEEEDQLTPFSPMWGGNMTPGYRRQTMVPVSADTQCTALRLCIVHTEILVSPSRCVCTCALLVRGLLELGPLDSS